MNLDGVISGGEQVVRGATILRLSPAPNAYCAEWSIGHRGSRGEKRWHGVGPTELVTGTAAATKNSVPKIRPTGKIDSL